MFSFHSWDTPNTKSIIKSLTCHEPLSLTLHSLSQRSPPRLEIYSDPKQLCWGQYGWTTSLRTLELFAFSMHTFSEYTSSLGRLLRSKCCIDLSMFATPSSFKSSSKPRSNEIPLKSSCESSIFCNVRRSILKGNEGVISFIDNLVTFGLSYCKYSTYYQ